MEGPKLLIFDGHLSHITLEIVELARTNDIHIIVLPPHSTHFLQPLDVAVFKPVKTEWRKVVMKHNANNQFEDIKTHKFPKLLKELVDTKKVFLRRHAVAGFEATGIYPLDKGIMAAGVRHHYDFQSQLESFGDPNTTMAPPPDDEVSIHLNTNYFGAVEEDQENENNDENVQNNSQPFNYSQLSNNSPLFNNSQRFELPKQTLEEKVANLQRKLDHFQDFGSSNSVEETEHTSSFLKVFGNVVTNTVKPFSNRKITQRKSGKCITSDESLEFLKEEKEGKRSKLEIAKKKELLKLEQAELKLQEKKFSLEAKKQKSVEKIAKDAEAANKKLKKELEKTTGRKAKLLTPNAENLENLKNNKKEKEILQRKNLNKKSMAQSNNQITCYGCTTKFDIMKNSIEFKSCSSCNSWFCSNCYFVNEEDDELTCNFCTI